jgi:hypothetical protein
MCGINFIYRKAGRLTQKEKDLFLSNLKENEERGKEAIGLIYDFEGKIKTFKNKGDVKDNIKEILRAIKKAETFLIAHTRQSTQEKATDNINNHPFENERFIWVHNGILFNDNNLKKELGLEYEGKTDSIIIGEIIKHYEKQEGFIQGLKTALGRIEGSFFTLLIDKKTQDIYLFKNSKADFSIFKIKNDFFIGSSDIKHIKKSLLLKEYTKEIKGLKYFYDLFFCDFSQISNIEFKSEEILRLNKEGLILFDNFKEKQGYISYINNGYNITYSWERDLSKAQQNITQHKQQQENFSLSRKRAKKSRNAIIQILKGLKIPFYESDISIDKQEGLISLNFDNDLSSYLLYNNSYFSNFAFNSEGGFILESKAEIEDFILGLKEIDNSFILEENKKAYLEEKAISWKKIVLGEF